jgi:hypothetical protein
VLAPDGRPASGVVVVSNVGGHAVTAADGSFELALPVEAGEREVRVTAVRGSGSSQTSVSVSVAPGGATTVGALTLQPGTCQPGWLPTFGPKAGTGDNVYALAAHDDGSGPALYAGGDLKSAGGAQVERVAKWDGASWSGLASGVSLPVFALAEYHDGTAPALYVGGDFQEAFGSGDSHPARWGGCAGFEVYCTAGTSASGCQASISASGTPSASASSGFDLLISGVEGAKDGLFFYGNNGRQANPWGSGTSFVCVVPPRVRGGGCSREAAPEERAMAPSVRT